MKSTASIKLLEDILLYNYGINHSLKYMKSQYENNKQITERLLAHVNVISEFNKNELIDIYKESISIVEQIINKLSNIKTLFINYIKPNDKYKIFLINNELTLYEYKEITKITDKTKLILNKYFIYMTSFTFGQSIELLGKESNKEYEIQILKELAPELLI